MKKVAEEKPPSLGKWSDKPQAADATHRVKRDVEYKLVSDPDEVIEPDQRVKAYQVGWLVETTVTAMLRSCSCAALAPG